MDSITGSKSVIKSLSQLVNVLKVTNDGKDDNAARKQWRKQRVAIQMALPSAQIHHSELGTSLSRTMMTKERSKKLGQVDSTPSPVRPTTAADKEVNLMDKMQNRGLKADMDDDGDLDEVDRLKQIDIIREMPVPLMMKKRLRKELLEKLPDYEKSGCAAWLYKKNVKKYFKRKGRKQWNEIAQYFVLWGSALTKIEGNHGVGVLTYFTFLRWLFKMNLVIFFASFLFLVMPQVIFPGGAYSEWVITNTSSPVIAIADTCSANYVANITVNSDALNTVLNFIQGTGWMENTIMFYGFYVNKLVSVTSEYAYNIPLAYTLTVLFYLLFSLILIVRKTSVGFKERLFTTASASHQFCNQLFGTAWDYNVCKEGAGELRKKSFHRNVIGEIEERRRQQRLLGRTMKDKCRLYTVRFFTNFFVFGTLCGGGYLIYYTTTKTVELTGNTAWYEAQNILLKFLVQYMTSLVITGLNFILPSLYKQIVKLEDFGSGAAVSVTLFRTVFLKLASLAILLITVLTEITCSSQDECRVGIGTCSVISFRGEFAERRVTGIKCWETKIGQEIYKLVIMDFFVLIGITFGVELPRWLISTRCSCKLVKRQEFDVAKEVLTLIYSETLLWIGAFFSPMIPAVIVMKNFIRFYMKYLSTMVFYGPSSKPYSSSDSDAFFMYVLLCAYAACVLPIGYCIWNIPPSRGCGPYRLYDKMYDIINITMATWPTILFNFFTFMKSAIIQVSLIIVLMVAIYYMSKIVNAYKGMIGVLREQLVMGNYDTKFLLEKLHEKSIDAEKQTLIENKHTDNIKKAKLNPTLPHTDDDDDIPTISIS